MRADLLSEKKCVHFKLSKDIHFALRSRLFHYNISMQELFEEFAELLVTDSPKAKSIAESIVSKKVKRELEPNGGGRRKKKKETQYDFDSDTLYNMINGSSDEV